MATTYAHQTLGGKLGAVHRGGASGFNIGQMPLTLFIIVAAIILYLHLSGRKRAARGGTVEAPGSGLPPAVYAPGGNEPTVEIPQNLQKWINPQSHAEWDDFIRRHPDYLGSNFSEAERERLRQLGPSGRP